MDEVDFFGRRGSGDDHHNTLFNDKVHSAIVIVKHGNYSHKRNEHVVRRFLLLHITKDALCLRNNGRISFSDVVSYEQQKDDRYVSGMALRRRLDWLMEKCPRNQEAQVLEHKLHAITKSEYGMTF